MRRLALGFTFAQLSLLAFSACLPIDQARNHLGETQCVTGKVIRVTSGSDGVHYLDFCEDFRLCPFSVVVFSHDMKNVGDVRQLAGKVIEIRGELKEYDDRAEIVLENRRQLSGEATVGLPPLPKNFDVEERGFFSAGQSHRSHVSKTHKKRGTPTLPVHIPDDVESD
jgi:hypothetical protein